MADQLNYVCRDIMFLIVASDSSPLSTLLAFLEEPGAKVEIKMGSTSSLPLDPFFLLPTPLAAAFRFWLCQLVPSLQAYLLVHVGFMLLLLLLLHHSIQSGTSTTSSIRPTKT